MPTKAEIESAVLEVDCSNFEGRSLYPEHFLEIQYSGGITFVLVHTFNLRDNGILMAHIKTKSICSYHKINKEDIRQSEVEPFAIAVVTYSAAKLSEKASEINGRHLQIKALSDSEVKMLLSSIWTGQN